MNNLKMVNYIKSILKTRGLQMIDLQQRAGLSSGLVARWTTNDPTLEKIVNVADYLGVTLDELISYNRLSDDDDINNLILATENKKIIWTKYDKNTTIPKQYVNPDAAKIYNGTNNGFSYIKNGHETSFYANVDNVYYSLYSFHETGNLRRNAMICLFIQPKQNDQLNLYKQDTISLIPLWIKVLHSLNIEKNSPVVSHEPAHHISYTNKDNNDANLSHKNTKNIIQDDLNLISNNKPIQDPIIAMSESELENRLEKIIYDSKFIDRIRQIIKKEVANIKRTD